MNVYVQIYSVCFPMCRLTQSPRGSAQHSAPYLPLRTTVMNKHGRGGGSPKMKITEWNFEEAGVKSTAGEEDC